MHCRITGSRHSSEDLPQGGLEIPCVFIFEGTEKEVLKTEKLVGSTLSTANPDHEDGPEYKKRKLCVENVCKQDSDMKRIVNGGMLSDQHIHQAQCLPKCQFSHLKGLQSTLIQSKLNLLESEAGKVLLQVNYP